MASKENAVNIRMPRMPLVRSAHDADLLGKNA
jgi:hypothetical protein